jgi:hypothetical protein
MDDTEAGHADFIASDPFESRVKPLDASSNFGGLCAASARLFTSKVDICVLIHRSLPQFKLCAKECKFCRYTYACFGEELIEQIMALYRVETGEGLRVEANLDEAHSTVEVALVKARNDARYLGRNFVFLKDGGMYLVQNLYVA